MFALSRSSRNFRVGGVVLIAIGLPLAAMLGGSGGGVIAGAFGASIVILISGWLIRK